MSDLIAIFRELLAIEKRKDSIEVGTPSKLGRVKVYGNALDVADFQDRIDNAVKLAAFATAKLEEKAGE